MGFPMKVPQTQDSWTYIASAGTAGCAEGFVYSEGPVCYPTPEARIITSCCTRAGGGH